MITYKLHILRTGGTVGPGERRFVGGWDLPLSDSGADELRALRESFAYPRAEMVFSSPLSRCVQTAGILYPDTWLETLPELADLSLGGFEGKTYEELKDDDAFQDWLKDSRAHTPPGGEPLASFQERILRGIREIFRRMMEEKLRDVAVVTHGGVIMSLLAGIALPRMSMGEWAVENGTGYTLLLTPQMWMRDGCVEAYCRQPGPPQDDGEEPYFGEAE